MTTTKKGILGIRISQVLFLILGVSFSWLLEESGVFPHPGPIKSIVSGVIFGSLFLMIETIYEMIKTFCLEQNEMHTKLISGQKESLKEISTSISKQISTEKSIMKIALGSSDALNYVENINQIFDSYNEISIEGSANRAIDILNNYLKDCKNFFQKGSAGGIYHRTNLVPLYKNLYSGATKIAILEPHYNEHLVSNDYTNDYVSFLEDLKKDNSIKNYLFRNGVIAGDTKKFLENCGFSVCIMPTSQGQPTESDKLWKAYSHLVFHYAQYKVVCSILPLFDSDDADKMQQDHVDISSQKYKKSDYFYLAFRVINEAGRVTNGDSWFAALDQKMNCPNSKVTR